MNGIIQNYGYCTIPKNSILYRGLDSSQIDHCMFFGTKFSVAATFNNNVQIWKTLDDITIVFLIENLTARSHAISSVPGLYNELFPGSRDQKFTDLDIKQRDLHKRDNLVNRLWDEYKISGWLTSVESKAELEICLFNKLENQRKIRLIDVADRSSKAYFKDSLVKIQIFPLQQFYDMTIREFSKHSFDKNQYKAYKRQRNYNINLYAKSLQDKEILRHYYYDLRVKLKI